MSRHGPGDAVEERRWPLWKICYFLFMGLILGMIIVFVVGVLVALLSGADYGDIVGL